MPFPKPLTFQFCYNTLINKKVINKYVSAKTFEKDYSTDFAFLIFKVKIKKL